MIKRIASLFLAAAALSFVAATASATESKPYQAAAFQQAQADGKTVLVDFAASWCPTCRKQGPVIDGLLKQEKFKDVVAFKADYDEEKDLKKALKVASQSTLVVFKGDKEMARAAGITSPEAIGELLAKGL
jgi:thiol-disulfide isomerase/thioredoxin